MKIFSDLAHLFYPHLCFGCGDDQISHPEFLCPVCKSELPYTHFADIRDNPVEKIFYGRIKIEAAMSLFYFSKKAVIQNLVHHLKYKRQPQLGIELGKMIGLEISKKSAFEDCDFVVPLPLYKDREKSRGYNQSALLCEGISAICQLPVSVENLVRMHKSETQTKKHRRERWQNVEGIFEVLNPSAFENKKILLVDDVITTGASLEACAEELLKIPNVGICIATLAIATE